MGFIIHTSEGFSKLDDMTKWKIENLASMIFLFAFKTDGKPKKLVIRPGKCKTRWLENGNVMDACIEYVSETVIAEAEYSDAIHIYLRLAREEPQIAFSQ
jgi:hypothetical protein